MFPNFINNFSFIMTFNQTNVEDNHTCKYSQELPL